MTVYLVGAGPGSPGLLTMRGAELLARADVVVHDRLVAPSVLALASPDAELVAVGKRPGDEDPRGAQEAINDLLVARGRAGASVVRLKGGDPYVFGRGGEEAAALSAAGVDYEVVPGVTAALAVPALAGIPVTHRGLSSAFLVVTAVGERSERPQLDWASVVKARATLVVLMGADRHAEVAERLLVGGCGEDTPVAVVERGGTATQRSRRLRLGELAATTVDSPATILVGEVAGLRLASFEQLGLFGVRVVVTRAATQSAALVAALAERGAEVVEFATLEFAEPADGGAALAAALADLASYAFVVFTSTNAVDACFARLRDARALAGPRVAAVGRATAEALARRGVLADLVPPREQAEGLLECFALASDGDKVLYPRAAAGRDVLPDGLAALGYRVDLVEAYRTVRPAPSPQDVGRLAGAAAVTFASPSAVAGYIELAGRERVPPVVATIGPVTSAAARAAGLEVAVEAAESSAVGLAEAVAAHFAALRSAREGGECDG